MQKGIWAAAILLAVMTGVFASKHFTQVAEAEQQAIFERNLDILTNPNIYSNSDIEEFNYIDRAAEKIHHRARAETNIDASIDLYHEAIDQYQGFKGHHYYTIHTELSFLYYRQGNEDQYWKHATIGAYNMDRLIRIERNMKPLIEEDWYIEINGENSPPEHH